MIDRTIEILRGLGVEWWTDFLDLVAVVSAAPEILGRERLDRAAKTVHGRVDRLWGRLRLNFQDTLLFALITAMVTGFALFGGPYLWVIDKLGFGDDAALPLPWFGVLVIFCMLYVMLMLSAFAALLIGTIVQWGLLGILNLLMLVTGRRSLSQFLLGLGALLLLVSGIVKLTLK